MLEERGEISRTASWIGSKWQSLMQYVRKACLVELDDQTWQDMENTCQKKINRFTEAKIRELTKNKKKYVINDIIVCIESV